MFSHYSNGDRDSDSAYEDLNVTFVDSEILLGTHPLSLFGAKERAEGCAR